MNTTHMVASIKNTESITTYLPASWSPTFQGVNFRSFLISALLIFIPRLLKNGLKYIMIEHSAVINYI